VGNEGDAGGWGWLVQLLARREVGLLIVGRMLTDPVCISSILVAKYLYDGRGLDQKKPLGSLGSCFSRPMFGALSGGWFSGLLVKRRVAPSTSRLRVMLGCAVLVPAAALIRRLAIVGVLALGMVAVLAHMAWLIISARWSSISCQSPLGSGLARRGGKFARRHFHESGRGLARVCTLLRPGVLQSWWRCIRWRGCFCGGSARVCSGRLNFAS